MENTQVHTEQLISVAQSLFQYVVICDGTYWTSKYRKIQDFNTDGKVYELFVQIKPVTAGAIEDVLTDQKLIEAAESLLRSHKGLVNSYTFMERDVMNFKDVKDNLHCLSLTIKPTEN